MLIGLPINKLHSPYVEFEHKLSIHKYNVQYFVFNLIEKS